MKIKRMIAAVTAFVLVGGAYPFTATSNAIGNVFAEDTEATAEVVKDGIKYTITDGKAVVSGLDDETIVDVVIPDEVDGCPVVEIGKQAFENQPIKSITLGKNVLSIGIRAFYSCLNLDKVILNDKLQQIDDSAFERCFCLTDISFGSNLFLIGRCAFKECYNLRYVKFENNMINIYNEAFAFTNIELLEIPEKTSWVLNSFHSNSRIGVDNYVTNYAIRINDPDCCLNGTAESWQDVLIVCDEDSKVMQEAKEYDLKCCTPEQYEKGEYEKQEVSTLDDLACIRTYGMTFKEAEGGLEVDYVKFLKDGTLVIPDEVNGIPVIGFIGFEYENDSADSNIASNIRKVIIGKNVKTLNEGSFEYYENIEEIEGGEGLEVIGKGAFKYLSKLKKIKLHEGLKEIGPWAFFSCKSLEEVNFPSTLSVIGGAAFEDTGLSYIVIPENIKEVGPDAFLFPNKEDDREITVKVLNPDCKFGTEQFKECFYNVDKLFGYAGSTAFKYVDEVFFSGEFYAFGDANCDYELDMSDIVLIMQSLANPNKYGLEGTDKHHITEKGIECADVDNSGNGITANDALKIQKYLLGQEKLV